MVFVLEQMHCTDTHGQLYLRTWFLIWNPCTRATLPIEINTGYAYILLQNTASQ